MSTILSNLDAKSLRAAEAVSKEWRIAAADLYVWREVYLRKHGNNDKAEALPTPVGGRGLGKGKYYDQNWKKMYRARHELAENWKNGNATAIYLNGHTDSVYCVQYDEYVTVVSESECVALTMCAGTRSLPAHAIGLYGYGTCAHSSVSRSLAFLAP